MSSDSRQKLAEECAAGILTALEPYLPATFTQATKGREYAVRGSISARIASTLYTAVMDKAGVVDMRVKQEEAFQRRLDAEVQRKLTEHKYEMEERERKAANAERSARNWTASNQATAALADAVRTVARAVAIEFQAVDEEKQR